MWWFTRRPKRQPKHEATRERIQPPGWSEPYWQAPVVGSMQLDAERAAARRAVGWGKDDWPLRMPPPSGAERPIVLIDSKPPEDWEPTAELARWAGLDAPEEAPAEPCPVCGSLPVNTVLADGARVYRPACGHAEPEPEPEPESGPPWFPITADEVASLPAVGVPVPFAFTPRLPIELPAPGPSLDTEPAAVISAHAVEWMDWLDLELFKIMRWSRDVAASIRQWRVDD